MDEKKEVHLLCDGESKKELFPDLQPHTSIASLKATPAQIINPPLGKYLVYINILSHKKDEEIDIRMMNETMKEIIQRVYKHPENDIRLDLPNILTYSFFTQIAYQRPIFRNEEQRKEMLKELRHFCNEILPAFNYWAYFQLIDTTSGERTFHDTPPTIFKVFETY